MLWRYGELKWFPKRKYLENHQRPQRIRDSETGDCDKIYISSTAVAVYYILAWVIMIALFRRKILLPLIE